MAIDNSWSNMFAEGETPHGFFSVNQRVFVVFTKDASPIDIDTYFDLDQERKRSFDKSETSRGSKAKNPVWYYLYKNEARMATVLDSFYLEKLGR